MDGKDATGRGNAFGGNGGVGASTGFCGNTKFGLIPAVSSLIELGVDGAWGIGWEGAEACLGGLTFWGS